jgi:hypothetical protein
MTDPFGGGATAGIDAKDDSFHPPVSDDRWWTETCWFSLDVPGPNLSATIYPLFRPNLRVCSLAVYVWDASAYEPWAVRYGHATWHLAMPETDLTDLQLEGLAYRTVEPLRVYEVEYRDGDRCRLDLRYEGLRAPHEMGIRDGFGHIDQPCRVTGTLVLDGEEFDAACLAMRDRSWHVRADSASTRSGYSYGTSSGEDQFLVITGWDGTRYALRTGYLVRDGVKALLRSGERRVVGRDPAGYPTRLELECEDELGRTLEATGTCLNRLANPATPGMFAWMSMTEWSVGNDTCYGEDQDVWSPDQLRATYRQ